MIPKSTMYWVEKISTGEPILKTNAKDARREAKRLNKSASARMYQVVVHVP